MDQRRFVIFLSLSLGFMLLWSNFVLPILAPPPKPAPVMGDAGDPDNTDGIVADGETQAGTNDDSNVAEKGTTAGDTTNPDTDTDVNSAATVDAVIPSAPARKVTLGTSDSKDGYFIEVECTSFGAGINSVRLSHPKFGELTDKNEPLQLLGDSESAIKTLATQVGTVDLNSDEARTFLDTVHWAVVDSGTESVTFETTMPGGVVVTKKYTIAKHDAESDEWDSSVHGYRIECELKFTNPGDTAAMVGYHMQGPVGVRLENEEHTRKFRDIKVGFFKDSGSTKLETITASEIYKQYQAAAEEAVAEGKMLDQGGINSKLESWHKAFKYISVDVQFFAAILAPLDSRDLEQQIEKPWVSVARPMLIKGNRDTPTWSDVSFQFESRPVQVAPGGEVTHKYAFYTGPKRETLVSEEPFAASAILDHGSIIGPISRAMLSLLRFLHRLGLPYWASIIGMTLLVRACMYPLSRKQALGAKKMKELQPKLTELKAKYGEDKEKMAKAQMELFRKNKYNPFAGCLPIFFQFPIFIGLYTALNVAVDLRLEPFLWCDNLAAPDKLARMPYDLPFLGSDFNLLPLITCVLFIVQQKMFMPPPTDEQQAMQQKMMSYMTIMFGFMFWHVPAGLCVYFIASSLWGLAERKLLDLKPSAALITDINLDDAAGSGKKQPGKIGNNQKKEPTDPNAKKGFFARLAEAAEEANRNAQSSKQASSDKQKKKKKKKK